MFMRMSSKGIAIMKRIAWGDRFFFLLMFICVYESLCLGKQTKTSVSVWSDSQGQLSFSVVNYSREPVDRLVPG